MKASDDFGLNKMSLHYSVNGGPEKTIDLLQKPGAKSAAGTATLSLEDFKLVPGIWSAFTPRQKDGHSEARTDISFIQADPFEREFSQSQQMAGGGGGGGGAGSQTDISKREKELIAATWKRQNEKTATPKDSAEAGKFLSEVQTKLQEQALALAARMDSRDLSSANEEFNSFGHDMQAAAAAMTPSADKLKQTQWRDAIPMEQKALQYLLRAEATFRQIEVALARVAVVVEEAEAQVVISPASSTLNWTPRKTSTRPRKPGPRRNSALKRSTMLCKSSMPLHVARKSWRSSSETPHRPCRSAGSRRCCAVKPSSCRSRWNNWLKTVSPRAVSKVSRVVSSSRGNKASKVRRVNKDNKGSKAPVAHRVDHLPVGSPPSLGPEGRELNRMLTEVRATLV